MCLSSPGPKVFTYLKLKRPNLYKVIPKESKYTLTLYTKDSFRFVSLRVLVLHFLQLRRKAKTHTADRRPPTATGFYYSDSRIGDAYLSIVNCSLSTSSTDLLSFLSEVSDFGFEKLVSVLLFLK